MGEGAQKTIEKASKRKEKKEKRSKGEKKDKRERKEKKKERCESNEPQASPDADTEMPDAEASPAPSLSAALAALAKPAPLEVEAEKTAAVAQLFSVAKPAPLPSVEEVISSFQAPTTRAQKRKRSSADDQPLQKRLKTTDDPKELSKSLDEQAVKAGKVRRAQKKKKKEEEHRTIFVGNVSLTVKRKDLEKHFKKYGKVESVRLRSLPIGTMKMTRKACAITGTFHEQRSSCNAYVVFSTIEEAMAALEANGSMLEGKHIRVDRIVQSSKENRARDVASIFIGNLPFDVEEEELWQMFGKCGSIDGVRVVRDKVTNQGKGIAYVAFKDGKPAVAKALAEFSAAKLRGRSLRLEKVAKRSKLIKPEEKKRNREAALRRAAEKEKTLGGKPTGRPVKGDHVKGAKVSAGKMRRSDAHSYQGKMAQEGKIPRLVLGGDKGKKYKSKTKPARKKTARTGKR